jgi:hypothetical protein
MNEDMERQVEGSFVTMEELKSKLSDVERVSNPLWDRLLCAER